MEMENTSTVNPYDLYFYDLRNPFLTVLVQFDLSTFKKIFFQYSYLFRAFMPYGFGKLTEGRKGPIITINYKRVVETWMDDQYKQFFYTR